MSSMRIACGGGSPSPLERIFFRSDSDRSVWERPTHPIPSLSHTPVDPIDRRTPAAPLCASKVASGLDFFLGNRREWTGWTRSLLSPFSDAQEWTSYSDALEWADRWTRISEASVSARGAAAHRTAGPVNTDSGTDSHTHEIGRPGSPGSGKRTAENANRCGSSV